MASESVHEYRNVMWSEHGRVQTRFARAQMLHKQLQALLDLGAHAAALYEDAVVVAREGGLFRLGVQHTEPQVAAAALCHSLSLTY